MLILVVSVVLFLPSSSYSSSSFVVGPNRCYSCGQGFRSHNKLHAHLAGGFCSSGSPARGAGAGGSRMLGGSAVRDVFPARSVVVTGEPSYDGSRGRAISKIEAVLSKGRTAHVSAEDRARAIRNHRRDVLDIATSQNPFPYLQGHFSSSHKIVRFEFLEQSCENEKRSFVIHSFIAKSSSVVAKSPTTQTVLIASPPGGTVGMHPGTRTEIANMYHYQLPNRKADFWSSSFLQAKGLEGESKATSVIASNVCDSCCTSCYAALSTTCMMSDCNTTAPSLLSVDHASQRIRTQRKCHARCRVAVSDPQ